MKDHNITFAITIFLVAFIATSYSVWFHQLPLLASILGVVMDATLVCLFGSAGYWLGTKKAESQPVRKRVVINVLFSYFFSYACTHVIGQFYKSWIVFIVLVGLVSYLVGWRLSIAKTANKLLNPTPENDEALRGEPPGGAG